MEDMDGDVGPEFTEDVGECVSADGESVFSGDGTGGAGLRGIIGHRNCLSDSPAKDFRSIEGVVPFVVGGDEDTSARIDQALPETALAFRIVTFVLVENRWQDENDKIIAVGSVNESAPVVSAIAGQPLSEFRVSIRGNSFEGRDAIKD